MAPEILFTWFQKSSAFHKTFEGSRNAYTLLSFPFIFLISSHNLIYGCCLLAALLCAPPPYPPLATTSPPPCLSMISKHKAEYIGWRYKVAQKQLGVNIRHLILNFLQAMFFDILFCMILSYIVLPCSALLCLVFPILSYNLLLYSTPFTLFWSVFKILEVSSYWFHNPLIHACDLTHYPRLPMSMWNSQGSQVER